MIKRIILFIFLTVFLTGCRSFITSSNDENSTSIYSKSAGKDSDEDSEGNQGADDEGVTNAVSTDNDEEDHDNVTDADLVEADWTLEIDDTQDFTQKETGVLYHYTLHVNATKEGGTDVIGDYKGQMELIIEVDMDSVKKYFNDNVDMTLDSFAFKIRTESENAQFSLKNYTNEDHGLAYKAVLPDKPLLQIQIGNGMYNAFTVENIEMTAHMENLTLTGHDNDGAGEGSGYVELPDNVKTVHTIEIVVNGADAYLTFMNIPLDRGFRGTLLGTPLTPE